MIIEIMFALSISAFAITVLSQIRGLVHIRRKRKEMLEDACRIFGDLEVILNDVNSNDSEELYEVDLSLKSYFDDNEVKMQDLANRLHERQPWLYPKDQILPKIGDLLEWLIRDFYYMRQEEEERIRIWSRNIPEFHEKKSGIFQVASH